MPVPPPKFWQSLGIYQHITLSDHTIDGSVCLFYKFMCLFLFCLKMVFSASKVCVGG